MAARNPPSSTCKSGVSLENLGCSLPISVETADFLQFLDLRDLGARGLYNKSRAPESSRSRSKRYPDLGQNGGSAEQTNDSAWEGLTIRTLRATKWDRGRKL